MSKSINTMPNKALSHTENRAKVCLLCFQKGSDMVPVRRGSVLVRIWKYFIENYDPNEEHLHSAVCARYRQIIFKIEKGGRKQIMIYLMLLIFPKLFLQF